MKSLSGSVYKTKDGRWFARVQYNDAAGRRRQKRRICITRKLADSEVSNLKREIERELSNRKTYRELDQFFRKEYVHAAKFVGGKKVSGYRQNLKAIAAYLDTALEFFKEAPLDEIGYSELREFKKLIAEKAVVFKKVVAGKVVIRRRPRSIADINHHLKWVRRLFNVGVEESWVVKSPFRKGLVVESHQTERTRTLSPVEETRLLAACEPWRRHLRPIIIFAVETGLRRGELQLLKWSDVNLSGRFLSVASGNSKTLKSRLVPLSERVSDTLAKLWHNSRRRESDLVFGGSDFKKTFLGACRDAELTDITFHDLRHTAITRWLEKGISPALAMKASGHSQSKTFMRYVNQSETSVADFAKTISRAA